jgi:hypothetical protein
VSRSTLTSFLFVLTLLLAFSAATGAASLVWKPEKSKADVNTGSPGNARDERDMVADFDEDEEPEGGEYANGKLQGQVTDARTSAPVQGVAVRAYKPNERIQRHRERGAVVAVGASSGSEVLTDVNGRYSLQVERARVKSLVTFNRKRYDMSVQRVGFKGESTLDVSLTRNPFLVGTVVDESGAKVRQYRIHAKKPGFLGLHSSEFTASYNSDDPFELNLASGTWDLRVHAGDYASDAVKISIGEDDVRFEFVVKRQPAEAGATSR